MFKKLKINLCLFLSIFSFQVFAAQINYNLKVQNITKNITGVDVTHALAINGSIPAPTLRFKRGDRAVIKVTNETNQPTTLHWHGLLVPWKQDGPQFTNTRIIEPKASYTFRFPIKQTGTYWYHSHTEFQEQLGLYGAIVIEEDNPKQNTDHDYVFVMSDWTNEKPTQILAKIKKDGDYYKYKKDFLPSIIGAISRGNFWNYLMGEWTRMGSMDLSDIGYDAFLINGKIKSMLKNIKHGEKIRFRIINASASTYFYFNIGNLRNFTVVSKDGVDVQPVKVNELLIGIAETYDVIFKMPHKMKMLEARATSQDITGNASLMFGKGKMEHVPDKTKPFPYGMSDMNHGDSHSNKTGNKHNMDMNHGDSHSNKSGNKHNMDMNHGDSHSNKSGNKHSMDMKKDVKTKITMLAGGTPMPPTKKLNYKMLKSVTPTSFNKKLIRAQVIELELSGDMERYTWYINGKPFSEDKYINIKKNEVITFKFVNTTMMHHPMHLHGHFFRVLMGQGKFAPLFHTVDVAPMQTVTIEFHANEPGIWFLHCHNLYHMKMGMARLVRYEGIQRTPDLKKDEAKWKSQMIADDDSFWRVETDLYSNTAKIELGISAGRLQINTELEIDKYDIDTLEAEAIFKKYIYRFLAIGVGAVYEDKKTYAVLTVTYNLPTAIMMDGYIRHDGTAVVKLIKILPLTKRLSLDLNPEFTYKDDFKWSFDSEFHYNYNERVSFGVNYKRDENGDDSVGFGIKNYF